MCGALTTNQSLSSFAIIVAITQLTGHGFVLAPCLQPTRESIDRLRRLHKAFAEAVRYLDEADGIEVDGKTLGLVSALAEGATEEVSEPRPWPRPTAVAWPWPMAHGRMVMAMGDHDLLGCCHSL